MSDRKVPHSTPTTPTSGMRKRKLSSLTPHMLFRMNAKRRNSPLTPGSSKVANLLNAHGKAKSGGVNGSVGRQPKASVLSRRNQSLPSSQTQSPGLTPSSSLTSLATAGKNLTTQDRQHQHQQSLPSLQPLQPLQQQEEALKPKSAANLLAVLPAKGKDRPGQGEVTGAGKHESLKSQFELVKQSREEVKQILDNLTEEQRDRYEVFRRTAINKASVRKLTTQILNQPISQTLVFVIAGFSKVFVGEVVEKALDVMQEWGDEGGVAPAHLREAYRRIREESASIPSSLYQRRLF